jgi:hypothetical protein
MYIDDGLGGKATYIDDGLGGKAGSAACPSSAVPWLTSCSSTTPSTAGSFSQCCKDKHTNDATGQILQMQVLYSRTGCFLQQCFSMPDGTEQHSTAQHSRAVSAKNTRVNDDNRNAPKDTAEVLQDIYDIHDRVNSCTSETWISW